MKPKYICIEGNIGVGKTTISQLLAKEMDAHLILEKFEENPFLASFYKEPKKYAFKVEMSFLLDRYTQLKKEFESSKLKKGFVIADYSFQKNLLFAENNLTKKEFLLYKKYYFTLVRELPKPDLIVRLHRPVKVILQNIKDRGRNFEANINLNYLTNIDNMYKEFLDNEIDVNVLIFNTKDTDFNVDKSAFLELKKNVYKAL